MKKNIFSDKMCNMLNLKSITTRSFVYLVDCILLGIVMVKVPGRNAFKLYFTIFSLCKKTLKDANSTSKCKITKCFCKSTPLVLRNSISFLVSH